MVMILIIEKKSSKIKTSKEKSFKIKNEKDMLIYPLLYLKYILIIVQKN